MKLAESIFEEETGGCPAATSPTRRSSSASARRCLRRAEMVEGRPLPATQALIDWFELSSKQRSFIEAAAAMNLAAKARFPARSADGPRLRENTG